MQPRSASPRTALAGTADMVHRRRWIILGVLINRLVSNWRR